MLLEAIFSIALIATTQVLSLQAKQLVKENREAASFGRTISDVIQAIDKRIMIDGRKELNGNSWESDWIGNTAFVNDMIKRELIAADNLQCGDSIGGWKPNVRNAQDIALIPCDTINNLKVPLGFTIEAFRHANATNPDYLSEWGILLYHSSSALFKDNVKHYPTIVNAIKTYDVVSLSGQHSVRYVDRFSTDLSEFKQGSDCDAAGFSCAILVLFKNSEAKNGDEAPFMRVDGLNHLMRDLTFRVQANTPVQCKNYLGQDVNCGISLNQDTEITSTNVNEATAQNYFLMYKELPSGTPVPTYCTKNGAADSTPCGYSMIEESGSHFAEAILDRVYATDVVFTDLESDGTIKIRNTLDKTSPLLYNAGLELSKDGIKYTDENGYSQSISFGSLGINVDAGSKVLTLVSGTEIALDAINNIDVATDSINPSQQAITFYGDNIVNKTSSGDSEVATRFQAYDGSHIAAINKVNSGSSVARVTCPVGDNGTRPASNISLIPYEGFFTDRKSERSCRLNSSAGFAFRRVGTYNWTIDPRCNVVHAVGETKYGYSISGTNIVTWARRYYTNGMGASGVVNTTVPLAVIQHCDY